jgi:cytochrome c biogenesis protein CcmG, thiol:disulfide interchange protein DsbE
MARISPLMILPLVITAGLLGLSGWALMRDNPDRLPSMLEGREAAAVALAPLGEGAPWTAADLKDGRVKIVNFWASWCAPCRAEHPNLAKLAAEGLPVYGVNYKDQAGPALAFLAELGNPFEKMGADESGRMGIDWGLYGVPETFVIDGAGKVILRFPGPITERVLDTDIRPALAKAAGE